MFIAALWAGIFYVIDNERSDALQNARRETAFLVSAYREYAGRVLTVVDQAALSVRADHARNPDEYRLSDWIVQSPFRAGLALDLILVDEQGAIRASSFEPDRLPSVSFVPEHLGHHLDPAAAQPYIGRPVRVSDQWKLQISRRLERDDGSFAGIVVASLDPHYLSRFFENSNLGPRDVSALVGHDGVVRAQHTNGGVGIGFDLRELPFFKQIVRDGQGTAVHVSEVDGTERIASYVAIPGYPLSAAVGLARDEVLSALVEDETRMLVAGCSLSVVILGFVAVLLWGVRTHRRDQEALATQAALLTSIIDVAPGGLWVKDEDGRFEIVNDVVARLLRRPKEEVIGRTVPELLPADRASARLDWDDEARRNPGVRVVREHDTIYDVQPRRIVTVRRAHEIAGRTLLVGSSIDITEMRQAEAAMRRVADAEAASRIKSEFLANMSHELRTPLNSILGFSEMMRRELLGPLGNLKYRDYAEDICTMGSHLLRLINDILDLTRAEAGGLTIEIDDVPVGDVFHFVEKTVRPEAAAKDLDLRVSADEGLVVRADEYRLRQVLLNLLSNAVKFTPAKGTLRLQARLDQAHPDQNRVVIDVLDSGIGMTEDQIEVALTPFRQIDNSLTRRHEGAGLGLPLAQRLVGLMGGTLAISSRPDQGTQISVRLPAGEIADRNAGTPAVA